VRLTSLAPAPSAATFEVSLGTSETIMRGWRKSSPRWRSSMKSRTPHV
jgi:hypothetical protein